MCSGGLFDQASASKLIGGRTGTPGGQLVSPEPRGINNSNHRIDCQSRALQYLIDGKAGLEEFSHLLLLIRGRVRQWTSCLRV